LIASILNGSFGRFSPAALKVTWSLARRLPPPPRPWPTENLMAVEAAMERAFNGLDMSKPLTVDLGCGLGSLTHALAEKCERNSKTSECESLVITLPCTWRLSPDAGAHVASLAARLSILRATLLE
jgi:hypothetical protein